MWIFIIHVGTSAITDGAILLISIFASYMRYFTRIPNVGIAFGLLANILAYLGLNTVSNGGFDRVLFSFRGQKRKKNDKTSYVLT